MYFFSLEFCDMTLASVSDLCTLATKPLSWDARVVQNLVKQIGLVESPSFKVFKTWQKKVTAYLIQSWQQSCCKAEARLDDLQKTPNQDFSEKETPGQHTGISFPMNDRKHPLQVDQISEQRWSARSSLEL